MNDDVKRREGQIWSHSRVGMFGFCAPTFSVTCSEDANDFFEVEVVWSHTRDVGSFSMERDLGEKLQKSHGS